MSFTIDRPAAPVEPEAVAEQADGEPVQPESELPEDDVREPALRIAIAAACPALAAAITAGGLFTGVEPRVLAAIAVLLGSALAFEASRRRSTGLAVLEVALGLFAVGLVAAIWFGGLEAATGLGRHVTRAVTEARLVRPPISLTPGFAALLAWLLAGVGATAVWFALVIRLPAAGMLFALVVAGGASISVAQDEKLIDGGLVLAGFAIGLGVLSGARDLSGKASLPLAYELRRAATAVPVLAVAAGAVYALTQTGLAAYVFPHPLVDPAHQPQRPKTVPLSAAKDRVLFTVQSSLQGPWTLGVLDVYDGHDWLLPPIASATLKGLPASGVVDTSLKPGIAATFTVRGLGGAVLPGIPNTVAIRASGPHLAYDRRSGNIRLVEGEIDNGFTYEVAAATVPSVDQLRKVGSYPSSLAAYTAMPPAPPAVQQILNQAPKTSRWAAFDWLRHYVLHNVSASGLGTPVSITPARADTILGQTKEASPFEIVALQAMLARWVGVPARIGYGFNGGTKVAGHLEVRPRDGVSFPEVYFQGYGWLPVLGDPEHAKASVTSNPQLQQYRAGVQPSQNVSVLVYLPTILPHVPDTLGEVRRVVLLILLALGAAGLLYLLYPVAAKALAKSRARSRARASGARARVVQAYAEWRDLLLDYGYRHASDTPIMLLGRFASDEDHYQLAWLVTRSLWGDLQERVTDRVATDAEELSGALRKRLALAHPLTVRAVAALSRQSLAHPYIPQAAAPVERVEMAHAV